MTTSNKTAPKAMPIKAVLFDLDGTLIDTASDFIRIINKMSAQNGWQAPKNDLIREQVSAGAGAMVSLMLTHNNQPLEEASIKKYRQQFLDEYEADICVDSQVFTELNPVLKKLEELGVPWGIVTNKPRYLAEILLQKLALNQRCDVLVCPDDVAHTKPDPEPMYLALEKLGLQKHHGKQVIYVGDHIRDIQAGNAADMITILAGYGYIVPADKDDLSAWQADFICSSAAHLANLLLSDQFSYAK